MEATFATTGDLSQQLDHVAAAPTDVGTVELVVCRPALGKREVLSRATIEPGIGLVGDNYVARGSKSTPDRRAHPLAELNLMSARALEAVAGPDRDRWAQAGDQFIVDFDLSERNAPAGTRLQIGTAIIEVTDKPHTGCAKFSKRFGIDAARWINSRKDLRLRGINAIVVAAGEVAQGDAIRKL